MYSERWTMNRGMSKKVAGQTSVKKNSKRQQHIWNCPEKMKIDRKVSKQLEMFQNDPQRAIGGHRGTFLPAFRWPGWTAERRL